MLFILLGIIGFVVLIVLLFITGYSNDKALLREGYEKHCKDADMEMTFDQFMKLYYVNPSKWSVKLTPGTFIVTELMYKPDYDHHKTSLSKKDMYKIKLPRKCYNQFCKFVEDDDAADKAKEMNKNAEIVLADIQRDVTKMIDESKAQVEKSTKNINETCVNIRDRIREEIKLQL